MIGILQAKDAETRARRIEQTIEHPSEEKRPRPSTIGPPILRGIVNGSVFRTMARMGTGYWLRAGTIAIAGAVAIAIPARLIPNGFFARMTPTRPLDYVFLAVSSILLGLTLAARPGGGGAEGRTIVGGVGTYLAVGCPICNKLVVALLGTSGALTYFAPIQPLLGAGSVALLAVALRRRLRALVEASCRVPQEVR